MDSKALLSDELLQKYDSGYGAVQDVVLMPKAKKPKKVPAPNVSKFKAPIVTRDERRQSKSQMRKVAKVEVSR
jgi:hypothetical protein